MSAPTLTKKDFQTDQEVRWCPGCGDYAILSAVQSVFPELGIPREKFVFVSGIGCSSRFPYYMNTYGFHTIHGRAPAVATGLKMTRPELEVWIATGDGDALSIGGNHLIHVLRRNVEVKILLFNNRIYGLTKGQYSPTSELGKKTKSTPYGSVDYPFNALSVAIGAGATFVARSIDVFQGHLKETLKAAAAHQRRGVRRDLPELQHLQRQRLRQPDREGSARRGAGLSRARQAARLRQGEGQGDPARRHRARDPQLRRRLRSRRLPGLGRDADRIPPIAFMVAQMAPPHFPTPIGVMRSSIRRPSSRWSCSRSSRRPAAAARATSRS